MRPTIWFVMLLLALATSAVAAAQESPAKCFANPERWTVNRKEPIAKAGERFLEDMRKCDSTFAAAIVDSVRYDLHTEETEKFTRSSKYVMAAYGVAWALLALSGLAVWMRQRRLDREIEALEAKLRVAEARGG